MLKRIALTLLSICLIPQLGFGAEITVTNAEELTEAAGSLEAGDSIILADGEWRDVVIDIAGAGSAGDPITLRAATPGGAIITGRSTLRLGGEHIVVQGLHFSNVEPPDNASAVMEFRSKRGKGFAYHSRLMDCLFENCNPADGKRRYPWVGVFGQENRIENCRFVGQDHSGVTVQIKLNDEETAKHVVRGNHFLNRPPGNGNGFECIQVGQSQDSMKNGSCLIEENVFEACDGETEIISVKTCENIVRRNLFLRSSGTLTLRHGNRNIAEDNIFIGDGKKGSGGIRVIGEDHKITGNYFQGLYGRTGGVLVLYAGIPDSPLNGYFAANRALVSNNVFLDNQGVAIYLNGGFGNRGRSILAEDIKVSQNYIRQIPGGGAVAVAGKLPGELFENNIYDKFTELGRPDKTGFSVTNISLEKREGGAYAAVVTALDDSGKQIVEPPASLDPAKIGPTWTK